MSLPVELGSGLISIGRPWGTTPEVPSEAGARRFLENAFNLGIRFFDTAPSYGLSEERLGTFLASLGTAQRAGVTIATKFGEHWDGASQSAYADHSADALLRSIDQSTQRLGQISVLQLHKSSPEVVRSTGVSRAIDYANILGISLIGASVSDPQTAGLVIMDGRFGSIQLPYNSKSPQFRSSIELAAEEGLQVITNRPFQMGAAISTNHHTEAVDAFRYVLATNFEGTVLTGTSNVEHLAENIAAFEEALH